MTDLRTVCSWCGKHLGGLADAPRVSHGICPGCRDELLDALQAGAEGNDSGGTQSAHDTDGMAVATEEARRLEGLLGREFLDLALVDPQLRAALEQIRRGLSPVGVLAATCCVLARDCARLRGGVLEELMMRPVPVAFAKRCPRKRTGMTPCVLTDGEPAKADDGACVGCGERLRCSR